MNVEVVAIGTELLLGQIVDTNSSWIGEQLALNGFSCFEQHKVGDNVDRIVGTVNRALERSDAVICCGGLGPTQDDLTREALAQLSGQQLEFDEDRADLIRSMFGRAGRSMSENNLQQANKPVGATFISQQPGTAPGLIMPVDRNGVEKVVYATPGVPWEMKEMMFGDVLDDLRSRSNTDVVISSRTLRTWGTSESMLAERLAPRLAELDGAGNPTLAFLASGIEGLKVRITTKNATEAEARSVLDAEEKALRRILGDEVFGIDDQTMEAVILELCDTLDLTISIAESVTGGLMASRFVNVPGASKHFVGGVVAYDSEVKFNQLGVSPGPVISMAAAEQMATGVRNLLGSSIGVGITGVAGPDAVEGRDVGTVCVGIDVEGDVSSFELRVPGRRQQVREFATISALNFLRIRLRNLADARNASGD